jgi:peptidoglycan/LPS O-acetylase OafA/YrhL
MENPGRTSAATGGRYQTLDGLRGLAALAVAIFHVRPLVSPYFPGGYLAVDLFFCLSGFVLAHAYDRKLASSMSFGEFARVRLIRLWPMYVVGAALGAVLGLVLAAKPAAAPPPHLAATIGLSVLFLPTWGPRLYPFDGPAWSLLLELGVNAAYALLFLRLTTRRLLVLVGLAGVGIFIQALRHGSTAAGATWGSLPLGICRSTYGFFLGVLICRFRRRMPAVPIPGIVLAVVLLAAMEFAPPKAVHGLYDADFVLVVAPLIVLIGSQARPWRGAATLGQISYPLYAIHWPLLVLVGMAAREAVGPMLAAVVAAVALAWLLSRYVDAPVRAWLTAVLAPQARTVAASL